MRLLFVSNLFPSFLEPSRGVFNAQQVDALAGLCDVVKVIAPTDPPLPPENRNGINVVHPHFLHVPLLSRPLNGWLFARAIESRLRREQFDMVLVNWAYPDAYGVMLLARQLSFPFATTVQGSDVNAFFGNARRKRQILQALRASCAVFCRSQALRQKLEAEGLFAITVYNGLDRQRFFPRDRAEACRQLDLPEPNRRRILYVGNLLPVKGPTCLAQAFAQLADLADVDLVYLGAGPLAKRIAAGGRVSLLGSRPHREIPLWMNACDVLCLPSLNEGMPNAVLEALACGLPVVASRVGGVPEVVRDGENGFLVPPADPTALASALRTALRHPWNREAIGRSVQPFDWTTNARTVVNVLQQALASSPSAGPVPAAARGNA